MTEAERQSFLAIASGFHHGERQAEHRRYLPGFLLQRRAAFLRQPDQAAVVAEVVRPQLRIPVEAELRQYRPAETAHQEIGEHVRAWLGVEQGLDPAGAGEQVVTVQARQPPQAEPGAQLVQRPIGAAVGIRDGGPLARSERRPRQSFGLVSYVIRPVVQQRGQAVQLHRPAPAGGDLPDMSAECSAGDHCQRFSRGRRAGRRSGR